ncbi:MAG TPA: phosphoribosylformylglycinamidine synthase subunit PurS [Alphaproteobacteria bacterium]|nr:phosphoribosylformylglycinamidine synthase subunit PurS [Alphaproteobacteria bacterium]
MPSSEGGELKKKSTLKVLVHITLKRGVLDPQGKAIAHALGSLGFAGVDDVRQGKYFEIELAGTDPAKARAAADAMCKKLLANLVIENYAIEIVDADAPSARAKAGAR